jgi:putative endonuclease
MPKSANLGKTGEAEAVKFLENQGYEILERNWRFKKLEVDIIAKHQQELVFAEVKARSTDAFGEPETFVTKQKQRFLIQAANEYIRLTDFNGDARFDILSVLQDNENFVVKHIQNAFYPSII